MKSTSKIWIVLILLTSFSTIYGQIKNQKTESAKVYGNCNICKENIEKAGYIKKVAITDWDEDTKMASITYNSKLTNKNAILKRIALSGYDNESFLAPDLAYSKLKECCQYERKAKILPVIIAEPAEKAIVIATNHQGHVSSATEHSNHDTNLPSETKKETNQMQLVFNNYFEVKDALVNTDAKAAASKASQLVKSLNAIKMNDLEMEVHMVWMKVMKALTTDANIIANSKNIDAQRKTLIPLTKNIYALMKVSKTESPTYYQFCPMANDGKGANWLSKENDVKNPYYGSEMLTCGKVVEVIK